MNTEVVQILAYFVIGIGTILGTVYGVKKQNDVKDIERNAKVDADLADIHKSIVRLEKKQDEHNNLISRMYAVEKDVAVLKSKEE